MNLVIFGGKHFGCQESDLSDGIIIFDITFWQDELWRTVAASSSQDQRCILNFVGRDQCDKIVRFIAARATF